MANRISLELAKSERRKKRSERDQLLSELFHSLNQPLTAVGCWLEITGRRRDIPVDVQQDLGRASECVGRIHWSIARLRELLDTRSQADWQAISLKRLLEELVAELAPVAKTSGIWLSFSSHATGDVELPDHARESFFRLLEATLACALAGDRIQVTWHPHKRGIDLRITSPRKNAAKPGRRIRPDTREELCRRVAICRVRELVEGTGGRVFSETAKRRYSVIVSLPGVGRLDRRQNSTGKKFPSLHTGPQLGKICRH